MQLSVCQHRAPLGLHPRVALLRCNTPRRCLIRSNATPNFFRRSFTSTPLASTEQDLKHVPEPQQRNPLLNALDYVRSHSLQAFIAASVAFALVLSTPAVAWAARSGGRIGGSSFGRSFSGTTSRYSSGIQSRTAPPVVSTSTTTILPSFIFPFGGFYPSYGFGYGFSITPVLFLMMLALAFFVLPTLLSNDADDEAGAGDVSVIRLQVGLLAQARELKDRLERLATRADTSTSDGLAYVLQETVLALLRNPSYCVYGAATTALTSSEESAERKFNKFSLQERSKFEQETLVNVGGGSVARSQYRTRGLGSVDELIVVTVLVAASGDIKLPKITSLQELKSALTTLGGLARDQVIAVEVLWTPQAEGDYFTRDDIIQDYPELNNL